MISIKNGRLLCRLYLQIQPEPGYIVIRPAAHPPTLMHTLLFHDITACKIQSLSRVYPNNVNPPAGRQGKFIHSLK